MIGGLADTGVMAGGGSSEVHGEGGPAAAVPIGGEAPAEYLPGERYHRSNPLKAIMAQAKGANVTFARGNYLSEAVETARKADVAIVFATEWRAEGIDAIDLSLPSGQDALIAAVAEANPNTIVVLETGGPVLMPWLDKTAGVLEAWYPGARGGEAIASILFGQTNPSGRLPVTFPARLNDLPRRQIQGARLSSVLLGQPKAENVSVDYNIEGSGVGYRWFAREGKTPLFAFGHGLTYTSFSYGDLRLSAGQQVTATFTVRNTGARDGADVPQLYLTTAAGHRRLRLAAFDKISLKPGETRTVTVAIDPRILADWDTATGKWRRSPGDYAFALGASAEDMKLQATVRLGAQLLKP